MSRRQTGLNISGKRIRFVPLKTTGTTALRVTDMSLLPLSGVCHVSSIPKTLLSISGPPISLFSSSSSGLNVATKHIDEDQRTCNNACNTDEMK